MLILFSVGILGMSLTLPPHTQTKQPPNSPPPLKILNHRLRTPLHPLPPRRNPPRHKRRRPLRIHENFSSDHPPIRFALPWCAHNILSLVFISWFRIPFPRFPFPKFQVPGWHSPLCFPRHFFSAPSPPSPPPLFLPTASQPSQPSPPLQIRALTYIDTLRITPSAPNPEYVTRMNRGIRDAISEGFPPSYVRDVMRLYIPAREEGGDF
ncbi:uncharacterized protein EAF02_010170 [Botrytis sinoallii]|uniref:uncharacterized protein n=1 Tax=Botrytis sinoallii TaxID=1463999 RepID=UPI001901DFBE|nr:uncharacterized protein EAF02_010170 [Botrytis sinoallii]KAF7864202.1 hypothetical protein EAF02_010170 [Botrytis sinoallii]